MSDLPRLIVRMSDVITMVGLSQSTIERKVKAGTFPTPFRLAGARARGWRMSDLQEWADNPDKEEAGQAV